MVVSFNCCTGHYDRIIHLVLSPDTALSSSATQSTASATITTSTLSAVSPNKAHSDLPSDSVALMIETSVRLIHSRLEQACSQGVEDVFCLGKRRETFLRAYQEYAGHVGQMEADLCAYLKVCINCVEETVIN